MEKPTLHEIAAMPFPASERALKEHYGVEPYRDGGPAKVWRVKVDFSWIEYHSSSCVEEVEASDEEEALALARKEVREAEGGCEGFEIGDAEIVTRPEE